MAYRIEASERVPDAVRRIAHEQIAKSLDEIEDKEIGSDETVHRVRKRCKKMRGLIRLARPAFEDTYREENASLRDAARRLSSLRDAASMGECVHAFARRYGADIDDDVFEAIGQRLRCHHTTTNNISDAEEKLAAFAADMNAVRARVKTWAFDPEGFDFLVAGAEKTYKRGVRAMKVAYADPTETTFHQWRKRVKYHWYHMRLLRNLWTPVLGARAGAIHRLSDLLGEEHDLAVLRRLLGDSSGRFGNPTELHAVLGLIDTRRDELQAWAHPLGLRVYAERPAKLSGRLCRYWDAWLAEQLLEGALPREAAEVYS